MKRKLNKVFSLFRKVQILHVLTISLGILIVLSPISSAYSANSKVTVMTRNLYLGADIFKVVEAAQNPKPELQGLDVPIAVAEVYQTMLYTNFWARAEAIADEIACAKPDVVGLNEVSTFYIQSPGDKASGGNVPAEFLVIDFYEVLNAALKARGMKYQAFKVTNAEVELPMLTGFSGGYPTFDDVRMVDHDYILVRKGLAASNLLADNYSLNLGLNLAGAYVEFTRGYLAVDVKVTKETYRFVSTHLEVSGAQGSIFRVVQAAQMNELLTILSQEPKPVILVGDFNSSSDDQPFNDPNYGLIVPPYMQAFYFGYLDSWLLQKKYDEGYTSGFDEYVSDPNAQLDTRIDLIFLDPKDLSVEKVKCDVVGDEVSDMVPNPGHPGSYLWPSDHAGVIGNIKFK